MCLTLLFLSLSSSLHGFTAACALHSAKERNKGEEEAEDEEEEEEEKKKTLCTV